MTSLNIEEKNIVECTRNNEEKNIEENDIKSNELKKYPEDKFIIVKIKGHPGETNFLIQDVKLDRFKTLKNVDFELNIFALGKKICA